MIVRNNAKWKRLMEKPIRNVYSVAIIRVYRGCTRRTQIEATTTKTLRIRIRRDSRGTRRLFISPGKY